MQLLRAGVRRPARAVRVVEDERRIHVAAARRARQPRQRRQPHRRVQRPPAAHRARAGPAAQVQRDDVELRGGLLQVRGHRPRDEGVRDAVEAVFAQLVVLRYLLVDGVGAVDGGDAVVEGGVEECDFLGGGEVRLDGADYGECRSVVSVMLLGLDVRILESLCWLV
jgi:hypothetical protein